MQILVIGIIVFMEKNPHCSMVTADGDVIILFKVAFRTVLSWWAEVPSYTLVKYSQIKWECHKLPFLQNKDKTFQLF